VILVSESALCNPDELLSVASVEEKALAPQHKLGNGYILQVHQTIKQSPQ
jgi:hypothetical protein